MKRLALFILIAGLAIGYSQTSNITATITDPDGQTWNNGTFIATFVPASYTAQPSTCNGNLNFTQQFRGSMNASGTFTVSVCDDGFVNPPGAIWQFTLCSNTSAPCQNATQFVTGANPNLSTQLSNQLIAPRFGAGQYAFGYSDVEVITPVVTGSSYYNVTSSLSRTWTGSSWVSGSGGGGPPVNVTSYGVVGDGKVATDCSITSGLAVVSCSTSHFVPGDVGKAVGMWGAGPSVVKAPNTYIVTLTSTIASYQSATQVTLSNTAGNTANPSAHFVWGTNNYNNLQTAISTSNTLYPGGYNLFFPAGYYLTPTIDFPCGAIGTFGSYVCTTATKNITVSGQSTVTTTIESFVYDRGSKGGTSGPANVFVCQNYTFACGLIMFGNQSTNDHAIQDSAHWVNGVTIHDLTLIEAQNQAGTFFMEPQNIDLDGSSNAEVYNVNVQMSSYMCIAGGNEPGPYVHDNIATHCGWGGPALSSTNSAINVVVPNSKTVRNRVYYSGQGIEGGAPNQEISGNFMEVDDTKGNYPPSSVSPIVCLNIESATYGMWNTHVAGNTCLNWSFAPSGGSAGSAFNTGVFSNMVIENNTFINSGSFTLGAGGEGPTTGWPSGEVTTNTHGVSTFRNNIFRYDTDAAVGTQSVGVILGGAKEKWIIDHIDIAMPGNASACSSCVALGLQGSLAAWQPSTAYTFTTSSPSCVLPPMPNGFIYCVTQNGTSASTPPVFPTTIGNTVSDGTTIWKNIEAEPVHSISNFHIGFPTGSTNGSFAISNLGMLPSEVIFTNVNTTGDTAAGPFTGIGFNALNYVAPAGFPKDFWSQTNDATPSSTRYTVVKDGQLYASSVQNTMSDGSVPAGNFYRNGDIVTKLTAAGGSPGWLFTTGGWKAKTWVATTAYAYNALVQASPDNLHLFAVTNAAGCTSGNSQPTWNTGAGTTTTEGSGTPCVWKESGASAQFSTQASGGGVSFPLLGTAGTVGAPTYSFTGCTSCGMYLGNNTSAPIFVDTGTNVLSLQASAFRLKSSTPSCWASGDPANVGCDTGLSRDAADIVDCGNGTAGDKSCTFNYKALATATNCQLGGASGTTSPAACGSATSGSVAIPVSQTSYTVNTTGVTANSHIFVQQITDNSGISTATCNAGATSPIQSARVAATSFTITLTSVASVTCIQYWIVD